MLCSVIYEFTCKEKQILFQIKIDDNIVVDTFLDGKKHQTDCYFEDSVENKDIKVILSMQGKTHEHTIVDDQGQIESDCAVLINSIIIDDIDVTELFCQGAQCYRHNMNGSADEMLDEFYGFIGCNGVVEIKFSVPLYKWFLSKCQ